MPTICLLCGENETPDATHSICDPCFNDAGNYIETNIHMILAIPDLLKCTRYLRLVCEDRLSIERETDNDPEVVKHYELLFADANAAIAISKNKGPHSLDGN